MSKIEVEPKEILRKQIPQKVIITDINMPFWDLLLFFLKVSIAVIPAVIFSLFFWRILYLGFMDQQIFIKTRKILIPATLHSEIACNRED